MDLWLLGLYAGASFLAVRSLVSLMERHKRSYQYETFLEEREKRIAEARRLKRQAEAEAADAEDGTEAEVAATAG